MYANNLVSQDTSREAHQDPVRLGHLAKMDELRVRLTTIDHNADAQTRSSPHPTYPGDYVIFNAFENVLNPKQVSTYTRNNEYVPHMSVPTQYQNFVNMIASPFSTELHAGSWESAMRGGNDMMHVLYDKVDNMLVSEIKPVVVEAKKNIMFSYYFKSNVVELNAQEFHFYTSRQWPATTGANRAQSIPYYDKDNPVFMPHMYISRALRHRACEILCQILIKFYRQPSDAQLPSCSTMRNFTGKYPEMPGNTPPDTFASRYGCVDSTVTTAACSGGSITGIRHPLCALTRACRRSHAPQRRRLHRARGLAPRSALRDGGARGSRDRRGDTALRRGGAALHRGGATLRRAYGRHPQGDAGKVPDHSRPARAEHARA